MLDVLAGWGGGIVVPLAVGSLGAASTLLPAGRFRPGVATAIGATALAFLLGVRGHLPAVRDAVGQGPPWFTGVAVATGIATAAAVAILLARGRGPEGVLLLGVGLGAAATALPDLEVLPGAAALWIPWALAHRSPAGPALPRGRGRALGRSAVAMLVAAVTVVGLVDGARGRPGALLIAPIVVGPVALASLLPPPRSRLARAGRAVPTGAVGLLVARHAALGASAVRPLLGSLVGLAVLALAGLARRGPEPVPPAGASPPPGPARDRTVRPGDAPARPTSRPRSTSRRRRRGSR